MPDILTSDVQGKWLDESVASADNLTRTIERAERKLVDKYRGGKVPDTVIKDGIGTFSSTQVQLKGWAEDSDGNPDTASMPDDLVTRLRDCVARIVTHWEESVDSNVESVSQGSKSVSYSKDAGTLPRSVWAPLRPYDQTTPFSPAV